MSESKTSENRLRAAGKQRRALELRKAGKHLDQIAAEVGYSSPSGAYKAVMTALRKTLQEPADEVRKLEVERLDAMFEKTWAWAIDGNEPKAVDRLLRIMERRAKLLGLDAPVVVKHAFIKARAQEVADRLGVPVGDVLAQAASVIEDALESSGVEL